MFNIFQTFLYQLNVTCIKLVTLVAIDIDFCIYQDNELQIKFMSGKFLFFQG